jgi:hypothetical protein
MEENRALKKIDDTRKKAKQIMDLKTKNDEMYEKQLQERAHRSNNLANNTN